MMGFTTPEGQKSIIHQVDSQIDHPSVWIKMGDESANGMLSGPADMFKQAQNVEQQFGQVPVGVDIRMPRWFDPDKTAPQNEMQYSNNEQSGPMKTPTKEDFAATNPHSWVDNRCTTPNGTLLPVGGQLLVPPQHQVAAPFLHRVGNPASGGDSKLRAEEGRLPVESYQYAESPDSVIDAQYGFQVQQQNRSAVPYYCQTGLAPFAAAATSGQKGPGDLTEAGSQLLAKTIIPDLLCNPANSLTGSATLHQHMNNFQPLVSLPGQHTHNMAGGGFAHAAPLLMGHHAGAPQISAPVMLPEMQQQQTADMDLVAAAMGVANAGVSGGVKKRKQKAPSGGSTQSRAPRRTQKLRTSRYRGVSKHRLTKRWEASCWVQKRQLYLGGFDCEEKAARAYDVAALCCKGVDACINFKIEDYVHEIKALQGCTQEELVAYIRRQSSAFARGKSRFRGVSGHLHRWEARIGQYGGRKNVSFGVYTSEEEAARQYDRALIVQRGRSAKTNFAIATYDREISEYLLTVKDLDLASRGLITLPLRPMENEKKSAKNVKIYAEELRKALGL